MRINMVAGPLFVRQPVKWAHLLYAVFVDFLIAVEHFEVILCLSFVLVIRRCGRRISVSKCVQEVAVRFFDVVDLGLTEALLVIIKL